MKKILRISNLILIILVLFMLSSCKKKNETEEKIEMKKNIYAQICLTTGEKINLELFYDVAPTSVENFVKLAENGFYKNVVFHRIIEDFMIQTGGYTLIDDELGLVKETPTIKGEFSSNGWNNELKHELGVISMARTSEPNSASSQFFICSANCSWLDGEYAAFGKTTDEASNEVVLRISRIPTYQVHYTLQNFPTDPIIIENIYVSNEKF